LALYSLSTTLEPAYGAARLSRVVREAGVDDVHGRTQMRLWVSPATVETDAVENGH